MDRVGVPLERVTVALGVTWDDRDGPARMIDGIEGARSPGTLPRARTGPWL